MKTIFIVSAICTFLALFWLAFYTGKEKHSTRRKRDIFLSIISILILLYTVKELWKISFIFSLDYILILLCIYAFLLFSKDYKVGKTPGSMELAFIFAIGAVVLSLLFFFFDFEKREEEISTEEIKIESSDYTTENILIINLRNSDEKINEFCIMKCNNKDIPLELSYSDFSSIQMVEKGNEKIEINKKAYFSYDLLAYFGFKEAVVTEHVDYSLYINEDSIKYK